MTIELRNNSCKVIEINKIIGNNWIIKSTYPQEVVDKVSIKISYTPKQGDLKSDKIRIVTNVGIIEIEVNII